MTPANSFAGVYGPGWITFPSVYVYVCCIQPRISRFSRFQGFEILGWIHPTDTQTHTSKKQGQVGQRCGIDCLDFHWFILLILFVYLFTYLFIYLLTYLFIYIFTYLFIYLPIYSFLFIYFYLCFYLFLFIFIYFFIIFMFLLLFFFRQWLWLVASRLVTQNVEIGLALGLRWYGSRVQLRSGPGPN